MNEDTQNNNKMGLFRRTSVAIIIFLILLFVGAFVYSHAEGWNYLDSLYFTVVTVTTIGYGDLAPQTDTGKIFTMFFPFIGIAMAFYFFLYLENMFIKKLLKVN